jgi:son of sevenless-like protein
MRNFSSTAVILTALDSKSIQDLKVTRKALSERYQHELSALHEIIDPQYNHRGYVSAIQSTLREKKPCIPWLAVHLMELDRVVRIPRTVLVGNQYLIDFSRYTSFMERVSEILYCSLPPKLEDERHGGQLNYLLNQLQGIDLSGDLERQLSAKSIQLAKEESSVRVMNNEGFRLAGFRVPGGDQSPDLRN